VKITLKTIASLLAIAFVTLSCSKTKTEDFQIDYKYDYFPLDSGHAVIYDVDSIAINDFCDPVCIDTYTFQVKEVVGDTFIDLEGDLAYEINRYTRQSPTDPWGPRRVWHAKRVETSTKRTLEKVEENLRFTKLVFPPKSSSTWLGNRFFTIPEELRLIVEEVLDSYDGPNGEPWEYHYTSIDVPATYNGLYFDSTLTVLQYNDSTLLNKTYSTEVYAKHVGMIYKEHLWLKHQPTPATTPLSWDNPNKWNRSGFILRMTVNSYEN